MKVSELLENKEFKCLNPQVGVEGVIKSGYVGDLLSWVMANGSPGCAWVTIQTHVNIIAVATLLDMSCVIIPEGAEVEESTLERAIIEDIPVITTGLNAYQVCKVLGNAGV
ncbi:MAG: AraC family transcriptional regulator [Firmicutes bacterium HGW-Firmicutes-4]|jgi:hypothetical protein|nr:MAG: AraC family transcriptional regulator [Firmicutes bacterium HGW-Firmicutes-4]